MNIRYLLTNSSFGGRFFGLKNLEFAFTTITWCPYCNFCPSFNRIFGEQRRTTVNVAISYELSVSVWLAKPEYLLFIEQCMMIS